MKKFFVCFAALLAALSLVSADKIAVLQPVGSGDVSQDELLMFWSMLEANVSGEGYELISRSALERMEEEMDFSQDALTDENSLQKAERGKLKTVKYVLVSKLGKMGNRYVVTLTVMDSSTGEIVPDRRVSETFESWTELSDKLKSVLRNVGLGSAARKYNRSAVMQPVMRVAAPNCVAEELSVGVEEAVLDSGIQLQNLKEVSALLQKNGIGDLNALEPDMYAKVGDLLKIDSLIRIEVTRCSIRAEKKYIEVTQRTSTRHLGDLSGSVRIISAQTGNLEGSARFAVKVDFDTLDEDTTDWEAEDFARALVQAALPDITAKVTQQLKK